MKKKITPRLIILMLSLSLLFLGSCQKENEEQMRHIVIFKYKPSATPEQIEKVTNSLADLEHKIPGITSFEHGINDSPENKNNGFTHVYMFTFENSQARDTYLPHPEHQKFGKMLGDMEVLEDAFVVDYVPEKD